MKACEHCGKSTRTLYPIMVKAPESPAEAMAMSRVLPRSALEALDIDLPWGEHPDDNQFEAWCESCAVTA
jgi:hypothetical protein